MGGSHLFNQAGGRCFKDYAGSKGLMRQHLKPLSMFWGVTDSTKAFVHNPTNDVGLAAVPLHSLYCSLSNPFKAVFKALNTVQSTGCMMLVKWAGRSTTFTASSLHSFIVNNVM